VKGIVIRVGEGIDVIMIWSTKGVYGTGGRQGPGRSAGHRDEGMGEEKGLIAGGSARRSTHMYPLGPSELPKPWSTNRAEP